MHGGDAEQGQVQLPPGPSAIPPLAPPGPSSVSWGDCDEVVQAGLAGVPRPLWLRLKCGKVTNVLDSPTMPGRGVTRLTMLRAGSGDIPIVVVNDVSGEPGTVHAARLASAMPQEFLTRFSLIGLDRRGTGSSEPVRCLPPEVRSAIVHADPAAGDVTELLQAASKAGQQCVINLELRFGALDTWRTAADLNRVRGTLGLDRLHAIGIGEGSRALSVFADRFPDRVGRMVLDGVPDPSRDSVASLADVAAGAEATFTTFAGECLARGCPIGPDPRQAVLQLIEQLRAQPLSLPDGRVLSAGAAIRGVQLGLADRPQWTALADAIGRARTGDGTALLAVVRPWLEDSKERPTRLDVNLVTGCNDTRDRLSLEPMNRAASEWRDRFPLFGGLMAQKLVLCGPWPVASNPPEPPTARGAPPIMVVSTSGDPITPELGTQRAARQLTSAVTISWAGSGHGALTSSDCATSAATAFLLDGKVPIEGTTCPP